MKLTRLLLLSLSLPNFIFAANAQDNETEVSWTGKGEVGYVSVSGNSESTLLNVGIEFEKIKMLSEHRVSARATTAESDNEETAESYALDWNSTYNISERNFTFGNLSYRDDKFDSFTEIYSFDAGFGYRIFMDDTLNWMLSIGGGYRDTEIEITGEDDSSGIGVGISKFKWVISETTTFTDNLRVEAGDPNVFVENIAAISVSMTSALALKIKNETRYNSEVSPGFKSTDNITSVNIVYSFE